MESWGNTNFLFILLYGLVQDKTPHKNPSLSLSLSFPFNWAHWWRNITVAIHVMQCSFNELSTLASDSAKCKQTKFDPPHPHVVLLAWISLTLSRHFSLSFIASGRSLGLHPVSSRSCCMYVLAGRPAFAQQYVGVHRSTSLMSSSLLLQQCPACLVRLTWIVFVMGGRWPYSWKIWY